VAGGLVLVRAKGIERYLRYFVALGARLPDGHRPARNGARKLR
jgi:hypothetical protein